MYLELLGIAEAVHVEHGGVHDGEEGGEGRGEGQGGEEGEQG